MNNMHTIDIEAFITLNSRAGHVQCMSEPIRTLNNRAEHAKRMSKPIRTYVALYVDKLKC